MREGISGGTYPRTLLLFRNLSHENACDGVKEV